MELEQEAAESRDEFSLQQDQAHNHNQHHPLAAGGGGGGGVSRRVSVGGGVGGGGGGERAEERALRAKNEMLERQLAHMREAAEEAQLELAAARKVWLVLMIVIADYMGCGAYLGSGAWCGFCGCALRSPSRRGGRREILSQSRPNRVKATVCCHLSSLQTRRTPLSPSEKNKKQMFSPADPSHTSSRMPNQPTCTLRLVLDRSANRPSFPGVCPATTPEAGGATPS